MQNKLKYFLLSCKSHPNFNSYNLQKYLGLFPHAYKCVIIHDCWTAIFKALSSSVLFISDIPTRFPLCKRDLTVSAPVTLIYIPLYSRGQCSVYVLCSMTACVCLCRFTGLWICWGLERLSPGSSKPWGPEALLQRTRVFRPEQRQVPCRCQTTVPRHCNLTTHLINSSIDHNWTCLLHDYTVL